MSQSSERGRGPSRLKVTEFAQAYVESVARRWVICVKSFAIACVALALFFGVASMAAAKAPLSPQAFTAAFAAAAAAAMPAAKVSVAGDLHLETRSAGGHTTTTDLHNAFRVYLQDPAQLDAVIRRYVAVLADVAGLGQAPIDHTHIVPVLKSRAWVEAVRPQRPAAPATQVLTEPFNEELTIVYAEDRPSSIRYLMNRDDVGDRGKLHELALANLNRLLRKIEMRQGADGTFLISAGGEYEPSLLLADGIWTSGQIAVSGDIVAAVPAKGMLLVTGSHNKAGIARLRAVAAELARGPYALTADLLVYRGGKWVTFKDE
jgi:uncharacterized protein YtpQ (UPF0354 family)